MSRLIDADALMEVIRAHDYPLATSRGSIDDGMFTVGIQQAVDEATTIDPVKHGRWVRKVGIDELINTCSECCYPVSLWHKTNYCPSCGAKMDGEAHGQ